MLLVGSAKLKTLAAAAGRHRTSLGHFFSRAFWPEADVLETSALTILQSMKPRRGEIISLILDDTRIAKRGRAMPALSRMWDLRNAVEHRSPAEGIVGHARTRPVSDAVLDRHRPTPAPGGPESPHADPPRDSKRRCTSAQPHKDVPLPTFHQRLAAFREDVKREQITRFANRIRQPKVRNRVKEFLLAM